MTKINPILCLILLVSIKSYSNAARSSPDSLKMTQGLSQGITSDYRRGTASLDLPLSHPLLTLLLNSTSTNSPQQVHLALAVNGGMTVSWATPDPHLQAPSRVMFQAASTSDASEWREAEGVSTSYTCSGGSGFWCSKSLGYSSPRLHHATLPGLQPNTQYIYRIEGWEEEGRFTTPPAAGPEVAFTYTLVGDLGQTHNSVSTMEHITASGGGLIVHVGDLSYADGYQPRWDSYGRLVQPLASTTAWMTIEGNHEMEWAIMGSKLDQEIAYNSRFCMPPLSDPASPPKDLLDNGPNNNFYSFVHGSVLWIMMGSYVDFTEGSAQKEWLKETLTNVDRSSTPWVFATMHAPWYNSNTAHNGEYEGDGMREELEDLMCASQVDGLFNGHVHAYERSFPVVDGKPHCGAPVYITIGDGGNHEGLAGGWHEPQPEWSAFRESSYGHATLDVLNSTHAVWKWHRNQDGERVVADMYIFDKTTKSECSCAMKHKHKTKASLADLVSELLTMSKYFNI